MKANEARKPFRPEALTLYLVTDRACLKGRDLVKTVEEAIQGGVSFLQYREKHLSWEERLQEAMQLRALADRYRIPFVINDDVALALACGADGVHLGQSDLSPEVARAQLGEDKVIGVTAKTLEQAIRAQAAGADYLGIGAAFGTSTKGDASVIDHEVYKVITAQTELPVVAIGGIRAENLNQLKGLGLSGVAVVSAILSEADAASAATELFQRAGALK